MPANRMREQCILQKQQGRMIMKNRDNDKVYKLVLTALMAALCYVAFTF